jgi:hypothetical protein
MKKKKKIGQVFGHLMEKIYSFFKESFSALCLFHCGYSCHALEGHVPRRPRGR